MVNFTDGATDGIVEQSVGQLVIKLDHMIPLAQTVKKSSPQSGRTTIYNNLD